MPPIPAKTLTKAIGLAGAGVAAWLTTQSAKGKMPVWQQQLHNHEANSDLVSIRDNWGRYSGQPAMDNWANKLRRFFMFGPLGLNMVWYKAKTYGEGFVNDVLLPNIVPIGVGLGGLYATGLKPHKLITEPLSFLKKRLPPMNWGRMRTVLKDSGKWMGDRLVDVLKLGRDNPAIAIGALAMSLFALHRFVRVYDHEEQNGFFRGDIDGEHNHEVY